MFEKSPFCKGIKPNYEGLIKNLKREGTPDRVYFIELFLDKPVEDVIDKRYGVTEGLSPNAPEYEWQRKIALQRFLGYDYVCTGLLHLDIGQGKTIADSTQGEQSSGERSWIEEGTNIITCWEDFEKYPWPDGQSWDTRELEWYEKNLPEDMCIIGRGGHFCEYLCWLMGYETLCYALYDQRDLVRAMADKILELESAAVEVMMQFDRIKIFWASDDLGFKTGTMISPADMREFVLSGHKKLAQQVHDADRLYLLHACGKREQIIEDLIEDVKLDAIHSWEDSIEFITDAKKNYGDRISLLGGIDVDFLCRASEEEIRTRVRKTVEICQPGGGFCLGTGNSVANYIPVDNYLIMLDEGRRMSPGFFPV